VLRLFVRALQDREGHLSFTRSRSDRDQQVWGVGGVVMNTLQLGFMTALAATLLALCFALLVTRTRLPGRRLAGVLAVLPMITPPFVIGLALIMLFGRSGAINAILRMGVRRQPDALDLRAAGCVARANAGAHARRLSRARRRRRGDQPEPRRGRADTARIAHAAFQHHHAAAAGAGSRQRLSDRIHRKPRRLRQSAASGGNLEVLSVAIYFAIVGVQQDPGRAAILAIILLTLSLTLFLIQRRLLAREASSPSPAKARARCACRCRAR
jgi:iron(III) transport system permease protein